MAAWPSMGRFQVPLSVLIWEQLQRLFFDDRDQPAFPSLKVEARGIALGISGQSPVTSVQEGKRKRVANHEPLAVLAQPS